MDIVTKSIEISHKSNDIFDKTLDVSAEIINRISALPFLLDETDKKLARQYYAQYGGFIWEHTFENKVVSGYRPSYGINISDDDTLPDMMKWLLRTGFFYPEFLLGIQTETPVEFECGYVHHTFNASITFDDPLPLQLTSYHDMTFSGEKFTMKYALLPANYKERTKWQMWYFFNFGGSIYNVLGCNFLNYADRPCIKAIKYVDKPKAIVNEALNIRRLDLDINNTICMDCKKIMKPDHDIHVFMCGHFVCSHCYENGMICCRPDTYQNFPKYLNVV